MGLQITVPGKGEIEFGVTSLPNRKAKALYRMRGANMEILAYFRTDEEASDFNKDLDFIIENCAGEVRRLAGRLPRE